MMKLVFGLALITGAVLVGLIRVDEATYMEWRLPFAIGAGLTIGAGIMLAVFGAFDAAT